MGRVCVLVTVLAAAFPANVEAAASQTIAVLPHQPLAGPVLMGERVVWAEARRDHGFDLKVAGATGSPQLMQAFPSVEPGLTPESGYALLPSLSASSDRLALEVSSRYLSSGKGDVAGEYLQAFATRGGPMLEPLGPRCDTGAYGADPFRSIATDGPTVAFRNSSCGPGDHATADHPAVEEFASGVRSDPKPLPGFGFGLRIAGRFVAWVDGGGVYAGSVGQYTRATVYDRATGAVAYSAAGLPARITNLELLPDGRLLAAYNSIGGPQFATAVALASPTEPSFHPIRALADGHVGVRPVGDQLLVLRAPRWSEVEVADGTLEVRSRDGSLIRSLAHGVSDGALDQRFDTDGERVAYVRRECDGVHLMLGSVAQAPDWRPAVSSCPLRLTARPRLRRHRRIALRFSCRSLRADCTVASVTVRAFGRRGHGSVVGHADFAGRGVGAVVPLNANGLRLLRSGRSMRLQIEATLGTSTTSGSLDAPLCVRGRSVLVG